MKHSKKLISYVSAAVMACTMLLPFHAQAVYTLGDVNQDGFVNAKDANFILIEAAKRGIGAGTQDTAFEAAADVNSDHEINAKDAAIVLRYAALVGVSEDKLPAFSEYVKGYTAAPTEYTGPKYDTCKAYWLDMSKQGDFTFNGEFLTVTFALKSYIPDGSYPVKIAKTDIASWEEVRYYPEIIDGEIAVGQAKAAQDPMSDKNFTLKVNSAEAKPGETVTMTIDLANNPGFCGFVIDIQYDANAMILVSAAGGKDYNESVETTK